MKGTKFKQHNKTDNITDMNKNFPILMIFVSQSKKDGQSEIFGFEKFRIGRLTLLTQILIIKVSKQGKHLNSYIHISLRN